MPHFVFRLLYIKQMSRSYVALVAGVSVGLAIPWFLELLRRYRSRCCSDKPCFEQLVGNTPLIKINSLSQILKCEVYGKAEFLNPGGSVKDRVALAIVNALPKGATIYEGTSGSTGISLSLAAQARGHGAKIFMPDDQAKEKRDLIAAVGGEVQLVRPMSIVDPNHMCKAAEKAALSDPNGVYANQFENKLNFKTHFDSTASEILDQTNRKVSVFVASAGTGGTVAGVSARLKFELGKKNVKCFLADPPGSALAARINEGTLFNPKDKEGYRVKHPFDTVTEGVGLNRLTANFQIGIPFIDKAFEVSDLEAVKMSRFLLRTEGLFLGSSSAVNCAAIVKAAKQGHIKPGDVVVTILCDSGNRHVSKFWSDEYLKPLGLTVNPPDFADPLSFISS